MPERLVKHLITALSLLVMVWSGTTYAARPTEPPTKELTRNLTYVILAEALAKPAINKVVFRRIQAFGSETDSKVTLRMKPQAYEAIELERRYVIAYSSVKSDRQFHDHKYIDPKGPRLKNVRGLGTPAVFENTPEVRYLFDTAGKNPPAGEVVNALLRQMARPDEWTRAMVVLEFLLRPELHGLVSKMDREAFDAVLSAGNANSELKTFVLQAAENFPADVQQNWLDGHYRRALNTLKPEFDLASFEPGFALAAINGLGKRGTQSDSKTIKPFLTSNAPSVARAAINAMDKLDRTATLATVENLLQDTLWDEDDLIEPQTRQELEAYWLNQHLTQGSERSL